MRLVGGYSGATISIADSVFENNYAVSGAGLYIALDFSLTAARTVFRNNTADGLRAAFGGGAWLSSGVAEFTACNFTGNFAWNMAGGEAGVLWCSVSSCYCCR